MFDGGKIIAGLVVFIVLVTSPLWFNAMTDEAPTAPELKMPPNGAQSCVKDRQWMRANHMDLLNQWRDDVVRRQDRWYTFALAGTETTMPKSLSMTCMDCHSNKSEFCDSCHTYMAVSPYCWECHVAPKEGK
jgi:hypothetical protein